MDQSTQQEQWQQQQLVSKESGDENEDCDNQISMMVLGIIGLIILRL